MATHQVDVVVVGLGPGGEEAAGKLAEAGLRVVGIDSHLVGGECPYYGCIPSKMIIRAADLLAEGRRIDALAGTAQVTPDYAKVAARIRDEATDDWDDTVAVKRLTDKGGVFVRGRGVLDGPGRVAVDGDVYVAERGVVLATGTSPALPPIEGLREANPWTNRDVFKLDTLPTSLAILGGGAIGLELAQAYARFGVRVTIIEVGPRILAVEEPETSELLEATLRNEGIRLQIGSGVSWVRRDATSGRLLIALEDGAEVKAAELLVAAGRTPNVRGIGLDTVGLDETARPTFVVDEHLRVAGAERLWAMGDIAGKGGFTHLSMHHAGIVVDDVLGVPEPRLADHHALSRVTFTDPEVGSVGMTERQARDAGLDVRVAVSDASTSKRGWIHGDGNAGLFKLVMDAERGVLVGASTVGPRGGEVLSMFNLAVHARIPVRELDSMIYAYPTFYRGAMDAVAQLR